MRRSLALAAISALALSAPLSAATLPPHAPLRILIVSDEVNPHGLTAAQLTQPGDISAALLAPGSGLNLDPSPQSVLEVPTDNLPIATAALSVPFADPTAYDVLVYFAHRIPGGANGTQQQADFVTAVNAFLTAGGGMISFHHGSYSTTGKAAILDLIGGTASGAVPWNTVDGQNVINVAPGHFVTSYQVEYPSTVSYSDLGRGVVAGNYPYFNNTPDERYPSFQINASAGTVEMLFASNYNEGGTTHVLGFTHRRPAWSGVVVAYQPGEYQPNALDDLAGNNFQTLANAILYAATSGVVISVDGSAGPLRLSHARPNPFREATAIDYTLSRSEVVDAAVYDVTGARVRTLEHGRKEPGTHRVAWDGRRDDGAPLPPGVYFGRITAAGASRVWRMALVK